MQSPESMPKGTKNPRGGWTPSSSSKALRAVAALPVGAGAKAAAEPIRAAMMADFMLEMFVQKNYERAFASILNAGRRQIPKIPRQRSTSSSRQRVAVVEAKQDARPTNRNGPSQVSKTLSPARRPIFEVRDNDDDLGKDDDWLLFRLL